MKDHESHISAPVSTPCGVVDLRRQTRWNNFLDSTNWRLDAIPRKISNSPLANPWNRSLAKICTPRSSSLPQSAIPVANVKKDTYLTAKTKDVWSPSTALVIMAVKVTRKMPLFKAIATLGKRPHDFVMPFISTLYRFIPIITLHWCGYLLNFSVCQNGTWTCTQRQCTAECSAWGDSHYKTFDGKHYDYQGQCDYVLAKGFLGSDAFDVTVQVSRIIQ